VLNTPTEHNFQDAFKEIVQALEIVQGDYFEGDDGQ
jgi:hypothetical protein